MLSVNGTRKFLGMCIGIVLGLMKTFRAALRIANNVFSWNALLASNSLAQAVGGNMGELDFSVAAYIRG